MTRLAIFAAILVLAALINAAAVMAASGRSGRIFDASRLVGCFGIFFILGIPISLLFALGNHFAEIVKDPSPLLFAALYGAGVSTAFSLALCIYIWRVDAKSEA